MKTPTLSEGQQKVVDLYLHKKKNVFVTGAGGCGKTFILQYLYQKLSPISPGTISVCALTGCASVLLQDCKAQTLHSFLRIGLGTQEISYYLRKMPSQKKKQLRQLQYLIIDEVSMMSSSLLELCHQLLCHIRQSSQPMGGLCVLFSGDFFQLGPVDSSSIFCFEHPLWNILFPPSQHILLTQSFRHCSSFSMTRKEQEWLNVLHEVRSQSLSSVSLHLLQQRIISNDDLSTIDDQHITLVRLFPRKFQVDQWNQQQIDVLKTPVHVYEMSSHSTPSRPQQFSSFDCMTELERMKKEIPAISSLSLKLHARVMCLVNICDSETQQLVVCNGSQGKVTFLSSTEVTVEFESLQRSSMTFQHTFSSFFWESERIPGIGWSQIPLCLSWAMTIHKCQGLTLSTAIIDLGPYVFDYGQTYVALSRLRTLEGLYLLSFHPHSIRTHPKVVSFYKTLICSQDPL